MEKNVALRIDGMLIGARAYLDGVAYYMKQNLTPEDYAALVKPIAAAMAETVEVSAFLHATFPDITPKELTDDPAPPCVI